MANKNVVNKDTETTKKTSVKKNSTSTTKKSSSKKNKSTVKKTTNNNKKTTNNNKKTTTNNTIKSTPKKDVVKNELEKALEEVSKRKEVDAILEKGLTKEDKKEILTKQEKVKKEVIDEVNNIKVAKVENAKYTTVKKKDKTLLGIGVLISLLGIIALILALIANRIIDREFISDTSVTLMICASVIIEGFGAFIIINES